MILVQRMHYPGIDDLLDSLLSGMQRALGRQLIGLYLHGSLVMGGFDPEMSDIDMLAATATEITGEEFECLQQFRREFYHYSRTYPSGRGSHPGIALRTRPEWSHSGGLGGLPAVGPPAGGPTAGNPPNPPSRVRAGQAHSTFAGCYREPAGPSTVAVLRRAS